MQTMFYWKFLDAASFDAKYINMAEEKVLYFQFVKLFNIAKYLC